MARVWALDLTPGASTWLAGKPTTDGFLIIGTDAADPNYPYAYENEGCKYAASVGPAAVPGITVDPLYGSGAPTDWAVTAWVERLFGPLGVVGSPAVAGKWILNKGRYVARHYIDTTVKPEAAYLLACSMYSGGLFSAPIQVGFYDDDGTNFVVDAYCGARPGSDYDTSVPIAWASIEGRYLEFDVKWNLSADAGWTANGFITVNLRTSTDLTAWTDLGQVINEPAASFWGADYTGAAAPGDPGIQYGYAAPLGFSGLPGACVFAQLYDDDTDELQGDEFEPGVGQSFGPLVWVEWEGSDGTIRKWAPVDLPDPSSYYYGYKAPRLVSAGPVVRALSDEQGEYQGQTFEVTVTDAPQNDDPGRDIRTLLGASDNRRHLINTRMVMRMISEEDWRAKRVPRTVAIGLLRGYRNH